MPRALPVVQECFGRVAAAMVAARVSMPRVLAWADWSSTRNRMTPTRMCRQVRRCAQLSSLPGARVWVLTPHRGTSRKPTLIAGR